MHGVDLDRLTAINKENGEFYAITYVPIVTHGSKMVAHDVDLVLSAKAGSMLGKVKKSKHHFYKVETRRHSEERLDIPLTAEQAKEICYHLKSKGRIGTPQSLTGFEKDLNKDNFSLSVYQER